MVGFYEFILTILLNLSRTLVLRRIILKKYKFQYSVGLQSFGSILRLRFVITGIKSWRMAARTAKMCALKRKVWRNKMQSTVLSECSDFRSSF